MNRNIGALDRGIRIVLGLTILGLGVITRNWWGALGAIPLGTALLGWCPLYLPFGISTCGSEDE